METYTYDSANNKTSQSVSYTPTLATGTTDPMRRTDFAYDKNNRLKTQTTNPGSGGLNLVESLGYDASGNVISKTDARGGVTSSTYDAAGRQISITDPLGNRTQFIYDRVGNRIAVIDARNNRTDIEYDKNNRIVKETLPQVSITIRKIFDLPTTGAVRRSAMSETRRQWFQDTNYDKNDREITPDNARTLLMMPRGCRSATLHDSRRHRPQRRTPARTVWQARPSHEYDAGRTRMVYPQTRLTYRGQAARIFLSQHSGAYVVYDAWSARSVDRS